MVTRGRKAQRNRYHLFQHAGIPPLFFTGKGRTPGLWDYHLSILLFMVLMLIRQKKLIKEMNYAKKKKTQSR